jgi:hypothetical protein
MTCPLSFDGAAYVLGALSGPERLEFERHLADCEPCTSGVREMAGLPGLLSRVDASVLETPPPDAHVPDTLLPSLFHAARRARRRRTLAAAGLAAAVAVAVAAVSAPTVFSNDEAASSGRADAAPSARPVSPAGLPMSPSRWTPMEATLAMESVPWGTRLDLTCSYEEDLADYDLPPSTTYVLTVRTVDGRTERIGTWRAVAGGTMHLSAATAAERADIATVEVRTTGGRVLLRLDA